MNKIIRRILVLIPFVGLFLFTKDRNDEFPFDLDYEDRPIGWWFYQFIITILLIILYFCSSSYNSDLGVNINYGQGRGEIEITHIYDNSIAKNLDLREGDVIEFINGERVQSKNDIREIMKYINYGDNVNFQIDRHGKTLQKKGTLKNNSKHKCEHHHNE